MFYVRDYASALRCIGQVLEIQNIDIFELRSGADEILVEYADPTPPYTGIFEVHYSLDRIMVLDREGQAQRRRAKTELRFDSLPEILRAAGRYVDDKKVQLRRLNNCSVPVGDLELYYQTREGKMQSENLPASLIRQIAVNMYKQRSRIANPIDIRARHH
jgi:hypothetical protein